MTTGPTHVRFRILGEFAAEYGGTALPLGSRQQRLLLLVLLLESGRGVSTERLVDRLWADRPPPGAVPTVHSYVSRIRRLLPAGGGAGVSRTPAGYALSVGPELLDASRFEQLARVGREQVGSAQFEAAQRTLTEALGLWTGPCLPEFADHPVAQPTIDRLQSLRLLAQEDLVDSELALGRHRSLVGDVELLVAEHPLRERLWAQLVLALYRSGRQAEALTALRAVRRLLAEQLGVDPGPALRRLEAQVLTQDPGLDLPARSRAEADPPVGGLAPAALQRAVPQGEASPRAVSQRAVSQTGGVAGVRGSRAGTGGDRRPARSGRPRRRRHHPDLW